MAAFVCANAEVKDDDLMRAAQALRNGATPEDAAEMLARAVEDDPDEFTVGYGGMPDISGDVSLDAAFMEGRGLMAGTVGGLIGFRSAVAVARAVSAHLPHVMLVGEGAARFGRDIGAEERDNLSLVMEERWRALLARLGCDLSGLSRAEAQAAVRRRPDLLRLVTEAYSLSASGEAEADSRKSHDTMNVLARGGDGHLAVAVTTSGLGWKYPGRVGDAPIIGGGLYVDDSAGAAACMGLGEVCMRLASASHAVTLLRGGASLEEAGFAAVRAMGRLIGPSRSEKHMECGDWVRLILVDRHGRAGGFATRRGLQFKLARADGSAPELHTCTFVPPLQPPQ